MQLAASFSPTTRSPEQLPVSSDVVSFPRRNADTSPRRLRSTPVPLVGLFLIVSVGASVAGAQQVASRDRHDLRPDARAESAAEDRAVLESFYHATGGPNWTDSTNWLSDAPLDQWFGVSTNRRGRVTDLFFYGNNLTGAIPSELAALGDLGHLWLREDGLTGERSHPNWAAWPT